MTTDKFCKEVRVPVWLIALLASLAIALTSFTWKQAHLQGQVIEQLKYINYDLDAQKRVISTKATKQEIERIYFILDRIERKVDRLNDN